MTSVPREYAVKRPSDNSNDCDQSNRISMSNSEILMDRYSRRADNCYDNAFMESCFGTLKNELEIVKYTNMRIATNEISGYLNY